MAVIIPNMDIPKRCFECKLKLNGACAYLIKPTGGANFKGRLPDCPLKSADDYKPILDKIIAEIEQDAIKSIFGTKYIFLSRVNQIFDKYKAESEEV